MRLAVQTVSHFYGATCALQDASFEIPSGEVVCLVGPSGCGKSTLLGMLGGMIKPTSGRIASFGAPPTGSLNPFTYVFQDFSLLPWRTVEDNIGLPLEEHRLSTAQRRERIDHALEMCGLRDFAKALPKQLSGGMKQRVGIARAVAVKPAVLLLDEPLSALDAQTRDLLIEDLLAIFDREAVTAVWVTHNLDEALRVGDRIVVLSRRPGRVKDVIRVDIPRADRLDPSAAPQIASLHAELWGLIRDEAVSADREVAHV